MPKKNELLYTVKIVLPRTMRILNGDIVDIGKDTLTIRYKKPRSSKYAMRTFAMTDVVAYSGAVGKASQVIAWDRVVLGTYKGQSETDGNFLKITQEDGSIMRIKATECECIAEEVDAPDESIAGKKKKKKPIGDKKVKK